MDAGVQRFGDDRLPRPFGNAEKRLADFPDADRRLCDGSLLRCLCHFPDRHRARGGTGTIRLIDDIGGVILGIASAGMAMKARAGFKTYADRS